jgi:hypothetical protein
MTLHILSPPRMTALQAIPTPSNLTGYLHSRPEAYLVQNIYALQPTHRLQAALDSGSCIQVLYTGTTDGTYGWTLSARRTTPREWSWTSLRPSHEQLLCRSLWPPLSPHLPELHVEVFQIQVPSETRLTLTPQPTTNAASASMPCLSGPEQPLNHRQQTPTTLDCHPST